MDIDYVLLWLVVISSGLSLSRLAGARPRPRGWLGVHAALLLVTVALAQILPVGAGIIGGLLWLVLVLVPVRLLGAMQRATLSGDFARAMRCAKWIVRLHPWDGYRSGPEIVAALELIGRGRFEDAQAQLRRSSGVGRAVARAALTQSFRQRADWEGALEWFPLPVMDERADSPSGGAFAAAADEVVLHLRALGETGNLMRLAWVAERVLQAFERGRRHLERDRVRAMLLAFAGRGEALERLLSGSLRDFPADVRDYWRAVALEAASEHEAASTIFSRLARDGSLHTQAAAGRRLARARAALDVPPQLAVVVAHIERDLDQELRFGGAAGPDVTRPVAVQALVVITLAVFVVEIMLGGSESPRTLVRMGALVPALVHAGQWWRLLAANFLHFGWLHVAMNMYGLWLLGPFAERSLGRWWFLLMYLVAGLGAMAGVVWLDGHGQAQGDILVGASGAVMGVVGATAGILLRGWWIERAPVAGKRLSGVAFIIGLQILFDLMTPMVSGAAHLWGLAAGFVWTGVTQHFAARPARRA